MTLSATLYWYATSAVDYVVQMLPCMLAATLGWWAFSRPRQARLSKLDLFSPPAREKALLLFVMYVAGLVSLTFFPADYWKTILRALFTQTPLPPQKLRIFLPFPEILARITALPDLIRPFEEIRRAFRGSAWLLFILIGNIVMFCPIGFFTALLWRGCSWYHSTACGFFFSVLIECFQLFIGRRTDIDDIILNTLGAFLGYILFFLSEKVAPTLIETFRCQRKGDRLWTK